MKFPRKLSKERLSLLSHEDRKIYEYEHSGLCPEMKQLQESKKKKRIYNDEGNIVPNICPKCGGKVVLKIQGEPVYVCSNCDAYYGTMPFNLKESEDVIDNSDDEITYEDIQNIKLSNEYSEEEKRQIKQMMDEMLFESQFDELFDKELIAEVGLDEYNNIKKNIFEYIMNDPDLHTLNEAEGHAADWWMDCSWILKLSAGLLTGLLGIIAWLFMKGKDRLAMMKLKQYMNKLVELTDSGVNKKRPWYSFLLPGRKNKQNTGDYNKACFRTIQETAERNMACLYTQCIHRLGFLSPSLTNFNSITNMPPEDSGLGMFANIANGVSDKAEDVYLETGLQKLVPTKINREYYQNISLPSLPTNYAMLMSNIDYPTKANENPNGSLFMKPTKEILQDKGSDIGLTYFNKDSVNLNTIVNFQTSKNESYISSRNSYLNTLFEVENEDGLDKTKGVSLSGPLTGDLDPTSVLGSELDQETKKREESKAHSFKGNLVDAIDNYITSTVPIVTKLMKAICGEGASSEMEKFSKLIITLSNTANGNSTKFMKKYDEVLKDIMDNDYQQTRNEQKLRTQLGGNIMNFSIWLQDSKYRKILKIDDKKAKNITDDLIQLQNDSNIDERDFNLLLQKYDLPKYTELTKIYRNMSNKTESYIFPVLHDIYTIPNYLYENEQIKDGNEILKNLNDAIEVAYEEYQKNLQQTISGIIENDVSKWYIIDNSRKRMEALKDAADKEITEKIGLICRTSQSAQSTLGDKFKAALSKHPVRAASLQNIWARYADDLNDRIESRIRSITGDNGNSNILDTIKDFLIKTYPNLIALMLYYKQIFYLIKLYTEKYPISMKSADDMKKEQENLEYQRIVSLLSQLHIHDLKN